VIITKTPFRMSFLGGGTDDQPFFSEYGGSVISTSIDKYGYITIRHLPPFFESRNSVVYSKFENTLTVDEIEHPLVRNAMKMLDMHDMRVVYDSDLPARSGIGSSSSFAAGLILGFHALKGKFIDKRSLARQAIFLERELCAECGGWQDQIAVVFGGLNRVDFHDDNFNVSPVIISKERKSLLNNHLMLFFTGFSRNSAKIADDQVKLIPSKKNYLKEMLTLVGDGEKILVGKSDLCDFGRLLDHAWRLKRELSSLVSTDHIDDLYCRALKAGAVGGKLMGAGGGGFLMIFAEPDKQESVKNALSDLLYVPFAFEDNGAEVMYYSPEDYIKRKREWHE
jgi:D-glycero-alpha-D-manno-heptose-7-phosphate kinase